MSFLSGDVVDHVVMTCIDLDVAAREAALVQAKGGGIGVDAGKRGVDEGSVGESGAKPPSVAAKADKTPLSNKTPSYYEL